MKKIIIALCLSLMATIVSARQEPLVNPIEEPLVSSNVKEIKLIRQTLLASGLKQGWMMKELADGTIIGLKEWGKHSFTVEIKSTLEVLSAVYKDSNNLNYEVGPTGPEIHPAYQKYIRSLFKDTRTQLIFAN